MSPFEINPLENCTIVFLNPHIWHSQHAQMCASYEVLGIDIGPNIWHGYKLCNICG
jgi:hypothetical protein